MEGVLLPKESFNSNSNTQLYRPALQDSALAPAKAAFKSCLQQNSTRSPKRQCRLGCRRYFSCVTILLPLDFIQSQNVLNNYKKQR
jgi:hypothetical protein